MQRGCGGAGAGGTLGWGMDGPSPHTGRGLDKTPILHDLSTGVLRIELPQSRVPLYLGNWGHGIGAKHASPRAPGGTVADMPRLGLMLI